MEAATLVPRKKLYAGGAWHDADAAYPLFSPYDGRRLAEIPLCNLKDLDKAVVAALFAFKEFSQWPAHKRSLVLRKTAEMIGARKKEFAETITSENSKPIKASFAEVERTVQTFMFAAEEAKRIEGFTIPMDAAPSGEGRVAFTIRQPIGVIGAITPFNFPLNLVAHKVAPAIASGNCVVLKPARQTPMTSLLLAEVMDETDFPPGALNVVTGDGALLGSALAEDPRIAMITFTGSPPVGAEIKKRAGMKRVLLELGSNSALIVDEGSNLPEVVQRSVEGAFSFAGQVCISVQRIYVHESLYPAFVADFVALAEGLKIGDPFDETTALSAMITPQDVDRVLSWIQEATEHGAKVACGGTAEGTLMRPTVLTGVGPQEKISSMEAFAPVVVINPFKELAEAIEGVNNSRYGLNAGVFTQNLQHAFEAVRKLQVGAVLINDTPTFRVDHMPYGGVKESGTGREGIRYAIEEMTELKLASFKLG
ncbi:MAG: aldehyde dehydrogenase family protein [Armatimonadetes bacterium]|nr:aldehyde dehydrogenase family protein [Armatimonadota bacterium]